MVAVHIVAGALGIVFGYMALYTAKGGRLHRAAGRAFVYSMIAMGLLGALIAAMRGLSPSTNVPVGLLTTYLVMTAFTAVRPPSTGLRRVDLALMLVAVVVVTAFFTFGFEALAGGRKRGMPAPPFFVFGAIGLLAAAGDVRLLRSGPLRGGPRLARHLWRMSVALLIAALSISVRLPRMLPAPLRIPIVLALPMLAVFVTMVYWLWRVGSRRSPRAIVRVASREAA